ncbi:MAG: protein translocase subunit secY/sec61 alpha [Capsulimonas sp.]|jgi:preprotein translocase subunit SecY|nr:protein translocase subunit secY/sec61 alpha [Capsulimonas sp.]
MAVNRPSGAAAAGGSGSRRRTGNAPRSSQGSFVEAMAAAFAIPELRRRLLFVFAMFGVYVVGLHIPIPGVNHEKLSELFSRGGGGGILSLVDVFTGGALKLYTIFAMGIVPYINASIIMQLLTFAIPSWQEMSKEGESGRRRIGQYTRYFTVALSAVQGFGMTMLLRNEHVISSNPFVLIQIIITLAAGTAFLMWIGEQITEKGIGNGISLIIFCGIMVRLPSQIGGVMQSVREGTVAPWQLAVLVITFFATVMGVIYVTLGQRKIPIQHVKKMVGNKMTQGGTAYLPFRVASAGVIPIIFALSIQLLPLTFAQFVSPTSALGENLQKWAKWMSPGENPITGLVYAAIIVFFTYFYTAVTMNVEQIADDLKKYGSYIPGIRPGKPTMEYLDKVMTRITLAGALFLAVIALMQYWIPSLTNTGGANGFTLVGGTSLLIVVGVALETMQAIEAQLLMRNYEGFIR